jgi:isopenicillin N synthase-like dioxygenase
MEPDLYVALCLCLRL